MRKSFSISVRLYQLARRIVEIVRKILFSAFKSFSIAAIFFGFFGFSILSILSFSSTTCFAFPARYTGQLTILHKGRGVAISDKGSSLILDLTMFSLTQRELLMALPGTRIHAFGTKERIEDTNYLRFTDSNTNNGFFIGTPEQGLRITPKGVTLLG